MPTAILITASDQKLDGMLNDSPTAHALVAALPLTGRAILWGEEIYFPVPVTAELDDTAAPVVQIGDLGYWPAGQAFCIFFGLTPASVPGEIRPASPVNLVGRLHGDPSCLKLVPPGAQVRLEKK